MASVYVGRAVGSDALSRPLAIKRLHPTYARSAEFVQGLIDEARILSQVHHPNVVQAIDVVRARDEVYVVLDYVRGDSLGSLMGSGKDQLRIPPPIAIAIAIDMLAGLHAAHEAKDPSGAPLGVVHRDVSPQNVVVGADGLSRVIDFGVAKAQHKLQQTRAGEVKGKLAYMAPEQIEAGAVDRRADIFAVGVVLWEMLTGRPLFAAATDGATMMRVLTGKVPPPSEAEAEVSPPIDAVVLRATKPIAEERFETAEQMLLALERAGSNASPRVVAAWVQERARDRLAESDRLVSSLFAVVEAQKQIQPEPDPAQTDPGLVPSAHTRPDGPAAAKEGPRALTLAFIAAGAGLLGYAISSWRDHPPPPHESAATPQSPSELPTTPAPESSPSRSVAAPTVPAEAAPTPSASGAVSAFPPREASASAVSRPPRSPRCVRQLRDGSVIVDPSCAPH